MVARFFGGAVGVAVIASAVGSATTLEQGLTWGYYAGAGTVAVLAIAAVLLLRRAGAVAERLPTGADDVGVEQGQV